MLCERNARGLIFFFTLWVCCSCSLNHFESLYCHSRCFISSISDYVYLTVLKSLQAWLDYIIISFFYNLWNFFSIFILVEEYGNVPFQQKEVLDWDGFIMWHTLKLNVCPENRELDLLGAVLTNAAWLTSCALEANRIVEILLFSTEVSYMWK